MGLRPVGWRHQGLGFEFRAFGLGFSIAPVELLREFQNQALEQQCHLGPGLGCRIWVLKHRSGFRVYNSGVRAWVRGLVKAACRQRGLNPKPLISP